MSKESWLGITELYPHLHRCWYLCRFAWYREFKGEPMAPCFQMMRFSGLVGIRCNLAFSFEELQRVVCSLHCSSKCYLDVVYSCQLAQVEDNVACGVCKG